ncbi:unnamed protein product [Acanthoscelides obtectus]|uniref:Uncharacterized protein n=1 Tax=Acanthoscelides obtectus TaxID=200917 RepID=A0A9P0LU82_ACAOB|nr:unnamed protein product [Acanthoscelides obtectus]
MQTTGSLKRQR